MPKYLCKTDLRRPDGSLVFKAGDRHHGHMDGNGDLHIEEDGTHYVHTQTDPKGWFHAFELVKAGWPEDINVEGVQIGLIHPHDKSETYMFIGDKPFLSGVKEINKYITAWLEAKESEAE